jgi:lactoylglutathione lyase
LASGATEVKPPETKPWGQIVVYVRDLNGFLVEICSEMP